MNVEGNVYSRRKTEKNCGQMELTREDAADV